VHVISSFRIPRPPRFPPAINYAIAVLLPVAAWCIQQALRGWIENIPFVLFFLVVSVVASTGGLGPGLVSVAASAGAGYFFLSGSPDVARAASAAVGTAVFVPVAALIAAFGALVRAGFREREKAAIELAEAVRVRDRFISTASHELKTPLTSLSLVVQQMARAQDGDASSEDRRRVVSLLRQTQRLARLVDGMLDVSRISSGRMHVNLESVDVSEVVREVGATFSDEAALVGATLTVEAPEPIMGQWDRMRLEEILSNLLSNAVKYGEGGAILASVRRSGDTAVIAISDEGMGIPTRDQERIFERYERGKHDSGYSGFGLGLFIVREIVTALSGTVQVESAPGQGATFTVVLPLTQPTGSAPTE
jgi:two-component system, OmpR family, sensor kinase